MTEPRWLALVHVLAIHSDQIKTHGGSAGLRDRGLLESALERPKNQFHYGSDPDLPSLVYYLRIDSSQGVLYKIGITNLTVRERYPYSSDQALITAIREWYYEVGAEAAGPRGPSGETHGEAGDLAQLLVDDGHAGAGHLRRRKSCDIALAELDRAAQPRIGR